MSEEIKLGSVVESSLGNTPSTWRGVVIALDGPSAWVRWRDPDNGIEGPIRSTLALSNLRLSSLEP